jgi:hypothetical protein
LLHLGLAVRDRIVFSQQLVLSLKVSDKNELTLNAPVAATTFAVKSRFYEINQNWHLVDGQIGCTWSPLKRVQITPERVLNPTHPRRLTHRMLFSVTINVLQLN